MTNKLKANVLNNIGFFLLINLSFKGFIFYTDVLY